MPLSDLSRPQRVTVLTWSRALGDTLLLVPALRAIRSAYPAASLHLVSAPDPGAILYSAGEVDSTSDNDDPRLAPLSVGSTRQDFGRRVARQQDVLSSPIPLHTSPPYTTVRHQSPPKSSRLNEPTEWRQPSPAPIRDALAHPELIVVLVTRHQEAASVLRQLGISGIAAAPHPPPGRHAAEQLLAPLSEFGIAAAWPGPRQVRSLKLGVPAASSKNRVLLHPGSGAAWKCAPPHLFADVALRLVGFGHDVVVIEGPADQGKVEAMGWEGAVECPPTLSELTRLLLSGSAFIGNDSGVTHLAALLGLPTVGLFGPTHPDTWGPLGPNVALIRACAKEPAAAIRVCEDPLCLNNIHSGAVVKALETVVSNARQEVPRGRSQVSR